MTTAFRSAGPRPAASAEFSRSASAAVSVAALPALLLLFAVASLGAGCSGSSRAETAQLNKKIDELEERLYEVEQIERAVSMLQGTVAQLSQAQEDSALMGGSGGLFTPDEAKQLIESAETVARLEQELATANEKIAQLERRVASGAGSASSSAPGSGASPRRGGIASNNSNSSAGSARPSSPPRGTAAAANTPRGGAYYQVQPGDTLSGLASRNGISIRELARANRLPETAHLAIGQNLWIPR